MDYQVTFWTQNSILKITSVKHSLKSLKRNNALARIATHMCLEKRQTVMETLVTFQFGDRPLAWMFYSRRLNNETNSFHTRALKLYTAISYLQLKTY